MHTTPQYEPIPVIIAAIAMMAMFYFFFMGYKESYTSSGPFYAYLGFSCLVVTGISLHVGKKSTKE
jgi:hypothetical protein